MSAKANFVETVHTLRQVVCVQGQAVGRCRQPVGRNASQNLSRNPNCMRRGPIKVDVILPTLALVMLRLAGPNWV